MEFWRHLAALDDMLGIPHPSVASDIVIPDCLRDPAASLRGWPYQRVYCWSCGSENEVVGIGRAARCAGCDAAERQQYREQEYRDSRDIDEREPDRYGGDE